MRSSFRPGAVRVCFAVVAGAGAGPPRVVCWWSCARDVGRPLIAGGLPKLTYDVLLLVLFRRVRPPEQAGNVSTPPARLPGEGRG